MEHGVTFASSDDDAFNLNAPISGTIKDAQIRGNPVLLRSVLGYTAASRAAQGEKQSFMDATKYLVKNMLQSLTKKLEIEMLYGQVGYAATTGATTTVMTIATAEWAPGIWAGAEGMPIEVRNAAGTVSRGNFTVVSVDMDLRTVTLDSDAAAAGVVNTDVIWHKGAYGNEFPGIHKILTTTGTLFNINTATYNLFKGNEYSAGSAVLDFDKLQKAVSRSIEKGLDSNVLVLINPRTWADLLTEQSDLRQYDQSYSPVKLEQGSKKLTFYSNSIDMEIESSIYVKEGFAYILCIEDWVRIGSSDITFKRPAFDGDFFRELENAAGYELRLWSDQALLCVAPGRNTLVKNIVNSV